MVRFPYTKHIAYHSRTWTLDTPSHTPQVERMQACDMLNYGVCRENNGKLVTRRELAMSSATGHCFYQGPHTPVAMQLIFFPLT